MTPRDEVRPAPVPPVSPVRVLFLYDHLGYPGGATHGLTTYCRSVLPRLDPALVQLTACFLGDPHPAAADLEGAGVRIRFLGRARNDPRALADVVGVVRRERSQVIHAAGQKGILAGRLAGRVLRRRVLVHLHDHYPLHGPPGVLLRATARWTDLAIGVSRSVSNHAVQAYRIPRPRVETLHNGIDAELFAAPGAGAGRRWRDTHGFRPEDRLVGMIGRLVHGKGHERLISLLPQIRSRIPGARLVVVGDGPLRGALEESVRSAGLGEAVAFVGQQNDIPQVMAALDLVAIPSDSEGLPYVALEAMAAGVPVVARSCGGTLEALGDAGELVDPADDAALVTAVAGVLAVAERAEELARRGRERVRAFDVGSHVRSLETLYLRLGRHP